MVSDSLDTFYNRLHKFKYFCIITCKYKKATILQFHDTYHEIAPHVSDNNIKSSVWLF